MYELYQWQPIVRYELYQWQPMMRGTHHLIGEDAINAIVIEVNEPIEALHLVLAHNAVLDDARLLAQAVPVRLQAVLQQIRVLHLLRILGRIAPTHLPVAQDGQWSVQIHGGKVVKHVGILSNP